VTPFSPDFAVALTHLSTIINIQMFESYNASSLLMPHRALVTKELADLLSVLSHPHRIRIIEELRHSERDVNSLQEALGISHSGVSQHLMLLRSHRLVSERREGRRVFYHLRQPEIASWVMDATRFLETKTDAAVELRKAIDKTRKSWAAK
jgi:DNA-binding transcriptional ArsR family regulator